MLVKCSGCPLAITWLATHWALPLYPWGGWLLFWAISVTLTPSLLANAWGCKGFRGFCFPVSAEKVCVYILGSKFWWSLVRVGHSTVNLHSMQVLKPRWNTHHLSVLVDGITPVNLFFRLIKINRYERVEVGDMLQSASDSVAEFKCLDCERWGWSKPKIHSVLKASRESAWETDFTDLITQNWLQYGWDVLVYPIADQQKQNKNKLFLTSKANACQRCVHVSHRGNENACCYWNLPTAHTYCDDITHHDMYDWSLQGLWLRVQTYRHMVSAGRTQERESLHGLLCCSSALSSTVTDDQVVFVCVEELAHSCIPAVYCT